MQPFPPDTSEIILIDTSLAEQADTLPQPSPVRHLRISKDTLEQIVDYKATDSMVYDISGKKILLYGQAEVVYGNINLKAAEIVFDWSNNTVTAYGVQDSLGKWEGLPEFSESGRGFKAHRMVYNFKSKKGKLYQLSSQEGEGYIHAREAKKDEDDNLYAHRARYTTCDLDHPHFWIEASPLKIVPDQVLVCGPANLVIEGVRTPLVLPFAIFPLQKGQRSGLIIPSYADSRELGFGLLQGGYYFGISDNIDLAVTGDIYTGSSWGLNVHSNYAKRYRYRGSFSTSYSKFRYGDALDGTLAEQSTFNIVWNYNLDPKAWPNNYFNANVNIGSSNYNTFNAFTVAQQMNNTFTSSIAYSRIFTNKPFNFSASLRHSQNVSTRSVQLTLPEATFGVNRINPFKRKVSIGGQKWYEKIGFNYTMNLRNSIDTYDSLLFQPGGLKDFRFGIQHRIPVNASFNLLKYFTVAPGISYEEAWYFERYTHRYDPVDIGDSVFQYVQTDTAREFTPIRHFNMNVNLTTRIYGRLNMKKGPVRAVRHVMTPQFSFNYRPDFGAPNWGYYDSVQINSAGAQQIYANFPTLYGSPPRGMVGGLGINLNNNLEMKVRNEKDTANPLKKIRILETFDFRTFYNFARDSVNLDPLRMSGRTTILERFSVNFSGMWDFYILDEEGRMNLGTFEWEENRRPARLEMLDLNLSTSLAGSKERPVGPDGFSDLEAQLRETFIPWDLSARYSLNLNKGVPGNPDSIRITQSLGLDFSMQPTPNWRVSVSTGFDFVQREITYTNVNIHRDLHCWEMRFSWIPIGFLKSYTFGINAKSTLLKDLKVEKRSNPYDNFQF